MRGDRKEGREGREEIIWCPATAVLLHILSRQQRMPSKRNAASICCICSSNTNAHRLTKSTQANQTNQGFQTKDSLGEKNEFGQITVETSQFFFS